MSMKTSLCIVATLLLSASAFAANGVVLINQAGVIAAGGFPFHITKPGSYRLAGNLQLNQFSVDGIDIAADDVTLDLNGFGIFGPGKCIRIACIGLAPGDGISSANFDITVKHGTVRGMNNGISLTGIRNIVEDIRAVDNLADGIRVGVLFFLGKVTQTHIVRNCIASSNGEVGIDTVDALVESNVIMFNGAFGVNAAFGATVLGNHFGGNAGGVECENCIVGSNNFQDGTPVRADGGFVSQGNNNCNGHLC